MTTVREVMCTTLWTLSPQTTLGEAIELLAKQKCSGAPVVDGDQLIGMITELELFDVLFDRSLRERPVVDFMSRQVWTISETDTLGHAAHLFALYGIRRLPVLRDDKLVGLISRRDVLLSVLRDDSTSGVPAATFIPFLDDLPPHNLFARQSTVDCLD